MKPLISAVLALALGFMASARAEEPPSSWTSEWTKTDFSISAVPFAEIFSGGPPKDGIPAINNPEMGAVSGEITLEDREPVVSLRVGQGRDRAYPVRYLMWHEIVNDRAEGGVPIAVTFCPLCNSAVVFDRRVNGAELSFGVSGKLRHSDMVMFDRETESWWQQFIGQGIVGELTGEKLTVLPSRLESWASFRERAPDGLVMRQPTSFNRSYGMNPYAGYDGAATPFLYQGEQPPNGVAPLARVVAVDGKAWPLIRLAGAGAIEEVGLRLSWRAGQASALDAAVIAEGRDVGDVQVTDLATGAPVVHDVAFAFAFHAFYPEGEWMMGD